MAHLIDTDGQHRQLVSMSPPQPANSLQPCGLPDVPTPVRSMMLDYMDDRSAVRCLSTCHVLHAGYHQYPVKRAVSVKALLKLSGLRDYPPRLNQWPLVQAGALMCALLPLIAFLACSTRFNMSQLDIGPVESFVLWVLILAGISIPLALGVSLILNCFDWRPLPRARPSSQCCPSWTSDKPRLKRHPLPRVQILDGWLKDVELLPYLQHATELSIRYYPPTQLGKDNPLPASLRTLYLHWTAPDMLTEETKHADLMTMLTRPVWRSLLPWVKDNPLPAGVLPPSLTSLHLHHDLGTRAIAAGVLPVGLRKLTIKKWELPLSHIAPPASLTELDIMLLANSRLPALPPQLEALCIGGPFNWPLTGVLPSSLRVLRLRGSFNQPFNAHLFASIPMLEDLYLNNDGGEVVIDQSLPSLRRLRLNSLHRLSFAGTAATQPSQLQCVRVSGKWTAERVDSLRQTGQARGFRVEQEAEWKYSK